MLSFDEGIKRTVYDDSTGFRPACKGKLTAGIGHNLDAHPLDDYVINYWLSQDVEDAIAALDNLVPKWDQFGNNRQLGLINLAFNLGESRLSKFTVTLRLINEMKFTEACQALSESLYAKQVKSRADRVMLMIGKDEWPPEYDLAHISTKVSN